MTCEENKIYFKLIWRGEKTVSGNKYQQVSNHQDIYLRGGGWVKIVILISIDRMSPSETKGGSIPRDQVQNNFNDWKKLGVAINNSKYKNIKRSLLIIKRSE